MKKEGVGVSTRLKERGGRDHDTTERERGEGSRHD